MKQREYPHIRMIVKKIERSKSQPGIKRRTRTKSKKGKYENTNNISYDSRETLCEKIVPFVEMFFEQFDRID